MPVNRVWVTAKLAAAGHLLSKAMDGIGTWLLSLLASLLIPAIPIWLELARSPHIARPETLFVTGVILSGSFAFSAQHNLFRFLYIILGGINIFMDIVNNGSTPGVGDHYALYLLLGAALLHASERFWWHVILERPFPDMWVKTS